MKPKYEIHSIVSSSLLDGNIPYSNSFLTMVRFN